MSFNHAQIWQAIDALARSHGLSPSGLAKRAGLDPTTFNPSKRMAAGKPRWPSTESIAKALAALNVSVPELLALYRAAPEAQAPGAEMGQEPAVPDKGGARSAVIPELSEDAYAVELRSDAYRPHYRKGDQLVISPSAQLRKGHRVMVKTRHGAILLRRLGAITEGRVGFSTGLDGGRDVVLEREDIVLMHRIVLASQ